ncbi:MAG: thioredoxin [Alphaproteobacteria bacterium]|nr:thioredoxin [Alphaproteobacteria bacterium]
MVLGFGPRGNDNQGQEQGASGSVIFDVTAQDFQSKVMEASLSTPVIVDFWAPWCGPCKQLMPALESAVNAAGGKVLLAKVNIDNNPELAQALQVQSVPTVFAFFQGQPVDAFMGVQPESAIKKFIEKLVTLSNSAQPDAIDIDEGLKMAAQVLSEGNLQAAQGIYAQILQQDRMNAKAFVGMVRVFIAAGQIEQAEEFVNKAPEDIKKNSAFAEAKTALELVQNQPVGDFSKLEKKVANNPKDHQAKIDLADALFGAGQKERACDLLLESIAKDPKWNDGAARKWLLKFFEGMGHGDPVTIEARRKLSSILFS